MRFPLHPASTGTICLRPFIFHKAMAFFAASLLVGLPAQSQTVSPKNQVEATPIGERKEVISNLAESKAPIGEKVAVLLQLQNRAESPLKAQILNRRAQTHDKGDISVLPPMRVSMERAFPVTTELELEMISFKREVAERITAINTRKLKPEERVEVVVQFLDLAKGAFDDAAEVQREIRYAKFLRKEALAEEAATGDSKVHQLRQRQAELRSTPPSEAVALLLKQTEEIRPKDAANPLLRSQNLLQPKSPSTQSK